MLLHKSSHFSFVLEEVLKHGVHIETSSAFDINILESLYEQSLIKQDTYVVCNGFKRPQYVENIQNLMRQGFTNVIPILDNKFELDLFLKDFDIKFNVGSFHYFLNSFFSILKMNLQKTA